MGCGWTLRGLAAAFRVLYIRKFNKKSSFACRRTCKRDANMLEHLEPVILQTLRVCRPYVAALTLEQGLQKCSEVVQAAQKPGMGGVWLPLLCACLGLLSALSR